MCGSLVVANFSCCNPALNVSDIFFPNYLWWSMLQSTGQVFFYHIYYIWIYYSPYSSYYRYIFSRVLIVFGFLIELYMSHMLFNWHQCKISYCSYFFFFKGKLVAIIHSTVNPQINSFWRKGGSQYIIRLIIIFRAYAVYLHGD